MSRTLLVQGHRGSLQSKPIRERFQPLPRSAGRDFMARLSGVLLAILCLALSGSTASAQGAYPNKTIRVLIPYAPGGLTDVVARYYADHLRKSFGQNVLVDNKPGASGIIAIEEMARAKPDGYTIMVGNISTNCLTPVLLAKRMRIDYDRDVQIITRLADPVGMIKAGKVRPLAVAADARLPAWPDVPTLTELGFTGFHPSQWSAAFAPAGVPREIIDKLHNAFAEAAKTPELQAIFEKSGMVAPVDKSVDDARAWLRKEMETWRRDIADAGIKVDE